ncbi:hypothetical protein ARTHRO9V_230073 [Arthrobacter sp. 9V]|nr:hypothetical protein ARTHRO9V_230073 [Arthrobacter sp. 9V]
MRAVCPISYAPKGSLTGRIDQLSQLVGLRPKFRSNGTGRKERGSGIQGPIRSGVCLPLGPS